MTFNEMVTHFRQHALDGPPSTDGVYFVHVQMRGLGLPSVFVANIWLSEPGELHIEAGPWEAFLKREAVVRHLPLKL